MINKLKLKSEFARNVLTLMTGTTIAQAIPIAISPILTRIYTPEDFGLFAIYFSIISIVSVFVTGKYELAIMLPTNDDEAFNIFILSIFISISISLIFFIFIFIFHSYLMSSFLPTQLHFWIYLAPISVLLTGIYKSLNHWSNRKKRYTSMSNNVMIQSFSNSTLNTTFGFINFAYMGLIITSIITNFLSVIYLFLINKKDIKFNVNLSLIKEQLLKYNQFPFHTMPQNLLYEASLQLPIFFIKFIFSTAILGAFSFAYRILGTPLSIIGNSLGQVYYQKASIMYHSDKDKLYLYTKKMLLLMFIASLTFGSSIVWFLPSIFLFIFGENWSIAGEISQYLMIYFIFSFPISPFTTIYLLANQNLFFLKWEVMRFILILIFFIIYMSTNLKDIRSFFLIYSFLQLLLYIYIVIPIIDKKSVIWKD